MANRPLNDGSGDNEELQALFDTIAEEAAHPKAPDASGDNEDLQHLFDEVSSHYAEGDQVLEGEAREVPAEPMTAEERQESVFNKIGQITRMLHDSLRELGYDRMLEETARQIPDARERLSYIATMTEQAASRVLNATDVAKPLAEKIGGEADALKTGWEKLYARELSVAEFKTLAGETRTFLGSAAADTKVIDAQLFEIMMAQDFQDLTGQVIKKIVDMTARLENDLLKVLLEVIPESKRTSKSDGLLNGPVVSGEGREDVVNNQEQVDDLLESLGF